MQAFVFKSELWTAQYTGVVAHTLSEFAHAIATCDEDTIYYHLYRNMFEYHFLPTDYGNSFAYWLAENGYPVLAEKFFAIDLMECTSIDQVRSSMLTSLEGEEEDSRECKPFHFIRAVRVVIETGYVAEDLKSLREGIKKAGVHTLFYHLVTSKLKHGNPVNDFSSWLSSIGEEERAKKIQTLDLIAYDLYTIREKIVEILE